jgi:fumarate hydratase subunit beta
VNGENTPRRVSVPFNAETAASLRAGEEVLLTGSIYTARDAAHARFVQLLDAGERLPVDLNGQVLYYTGPTPPRPGRVSGSAGPTTSCRMDIFTPKLLRLAGLRGMIGKGPRSRAVVDAIRETGAVYFAALGGAGALLGGCVRASEVVCYEDLGTEAVRRLRVVEMPLIVAVDSTGNDVYIFGPEGFRTE